jgi:hypothetical protein
VSRHWRVSLRPIDGALMMAGFGMVDFSVRHRNRVSTTVTFA